MSEYVVPNVAVLASNRGFIQVVVSTYHPGRILYTVHAYSSVIKQWVQTDYRCTDLWEFADRMIDILPLYEWSEDAQILLNNFRYGARRKQNFQPGDRVVSLNSGKIGTVLKFMGFASSSTANAMYRCRWDNGSKSDRFFEASLVAYDVWMAIQIPCQMPQYCNVDGSTFTAGVEG